MKNKIIFYGVIGLLLLALAFIVYVSLPDGGEGVAPDDDTEDDMTFNPKGDPDARQITFKDVRRMNRQQLLEDEIMDTYKDGIHSFHDPLMILDPYESMPLSALVMFETDKPARIHVTVQGKDSDTDLEFLYEKFETEHFLPILGLYPDEENTVILDYMTEDNETDQVELTVETEALPDDFLEPDLVESNPESMEDGLTFMIPSRKYMYAIDSNADVRWYSTLPTRHIFERLDNQHVLFVTGNEGDGKYNELLEMDLLGKVYNTTMIDIKDYTKNNPLPHDIIEMPHGNFLATTHEPESDDVNDQLTEIDHSTGKTVRNMSIKDVFPAEAYEEYEGKNAGEGDWIHQNAIWMDDSDNHILISGRNQDAILKSSYPDMDIDWILAAHEDWPEAYDAYLLEPLGDVKFPAGQHTVEVLPPQDAELDSTGVLVFDNNAVRTRGNEDASGTYSRAVQYRIDEADMSVEEVWSYGEERGQSFHSSIGGNTQYLREAGNILLTSGFTEDEGETNKRRSRVVEVTKDDDPEIVFEVVSPAFDKNSSRQVDRGVRMPLYPDGPWYFEFDAEK